MVNRHVLINLKWFLINSVGMIVLLLVTVLTYWHWHNCWQLIDSFCPSEQTAGAVFKYVAVSAQVVGVAFVILALNEHLKIFRNTSLITLLINKIKQIPYIFKRVSQHVGSGHSTLPSLTSSVGLSTSQKPETLEERLAALEKEMAQAFQKIDRINSDFKSYKSSIENQFAQLNIKIAQLRADLENKIDGVAIGDLGFALWAIYLMMYSAIVGALA